MVLPPWTFGNSTVGGIAKLLLPKSVVAVSTGRFIPGKVTEIGRNRLSATGPKNKASPSNYSNQTFSWIDRQALVEDVALDKGVKNN